MRFRALISKNNKKCLYTICLIVLVVALSGIGVFAAEKSTTAQERIKYISDDVVITESESGDGPMDFAYSGSRLKSGEEYVVMVVDGTADEYSISGETILYIDQASAVADTKGAKLTFDIYPKEQKNSVVLLSGIIDGTAKQIPVAELNYSAVTGYKITGKISSYNPVNETKVTLMQGDVKKYSATIASSTGTGLKTQEFKIEGVIPGTYDLVVEKVGHLKYTIKNIRVNNADIDLKTDTRAYISEIRLPAGDINGDGYINPTDFTTILRTENYGKLTSEAGEKRCDINGDGYINPTDFTIVLQTENYGKSNLEYNY